MEDVVGVPRRLHAERNLQVLRASGSELEREFPFGIALQLFEPPLASAGAAREPLLADAASLSAPLFEPGPTRSASTEGKEFPLLHGLYWLTANLAERAPLLLAVDDVHWADPSSLRFLLYLAQRLSDLPAIALFALRPAEPGAPGELLAQLSAHPLAQQLRPPPLSQAAVERLVRERFPAAEEEFCRSCAKVTEGNPFLLRELLNAVAAEGVEPTAKGSARVGELAPEAVMRAVLVRLARLHDGASALAHAAAVLGPDATLARAAALGRLELGIARSAADALAAADILRCEDTLRFAHPLLRSTIYAELRPAERAALHRRAAALVSEEGVAPEAVASHLLRAERAGDPWVVATLRHAARRARSEGAPAVAAEFLRRALAEPPSLALRGELRLEVARAESAAGERQAGERFSAALELITEPRSCAVLLRDLAQFLFTTGRPKEAVAAVERGLTELDGEDDELERQLAVVWLAAARADISLRAEAIERLRTIVERPEVDDSPAGRAALAAAADHSVLAGEDHRRALDLAKRSWAEGSLLSEDTCDGSAWFLALGAFGWSDDFESYERGCHAGLEDARRRGSIVGFAGASYLLNFSHYYAGRLTDAVADAQQAVEARHYGWEQHLGAAVGQLAWSLTERGQLEEAEAALAIVAVEGPWAAHGIHPFVADARARIATARGDARGALDAARLAGEWMATARATNPSVLPWRSHAALAAARLGEREQAEELAEEELRLAGQFGAPRPRGVALRAMGLIEGGRRGIELLGEAVTTLERSPAQLEHARALIDYGAALRRAGNRADSRKPLRHGLDMAHRFGAVLLERQAHQELLASGARPRRTALRGVAALTPSERRVAEMAAEGLGNREIAQALFVTLRTVEAHLSHAYDKLAICSRSELTTAMTQPGE